MKQSYYLLIREVKHKSINKLKCLSIIVITIIIALYHSHAQSLYEVKQAMEFFYFNKMQRGDIGSSLGLEDIEGSPYLNDDFINGSVFTKSKTEFVGVPLRYNIFNDNIEFKTEDGTVMAVAGPETIEKIEFGDHKMMYLPYGNINKPRKGYFIVIEEGKASLLSRPRMAFQEAKEPAAYQDAQPAKFIRQTDEYYIRVGDRLAQLMRKKSDLSDVFPDHKKEIQAFIKDNRIRANKPDALKELVQYYNSL